MTLEALNVVVDDRMSFSSVGNRFHSPHTGCSDRERTVSESPLRPWKKEVAIAGGAQRRACWYDGDRCEYRLEKDVWPTNDL